MGKKKKEEVIDGAAEVASTDAPAQALTGLEIERPEASAPPDAGTLLDIPATTLDGEPLDIKGIKVESDVDYGGAHKYHITNSLGFSEGENKYDESEQVLQFVQKAFDGSITPGLQSEQVAIVLLDRATKLNARFPSEQYHKMAAGLNMFLEACRERVNERKARGVMGELKK